jgi:hypothetical protein
MKSLVFVALFVVALPRVSAAEGFISPILDTTVNSPSATANRTSAGFGVAFGRLGQIAGTESEIAYYPELIGNPNGGLLRHRVFTFSQNFLIGPTIGRVKPYGDIGFGDLLLNVSSIASLAGVSADGSSVFNNYFAINAGGGLMAFFTKKLGVRGDVRYFKAFGFDPSSFASSELAITEFDFWRASIGLAFKF